MSRYLRAEPLDLAELLAETTDPSCGALVVFSGTVRNHHGGKQVQRLSYTAHAVLLDKAFRELERETIERFGVAQCRLIHREGELDVGEDSVLVVVRSAHRAEAFEAARYAIDTLKQRAPVWKQEFYADGSVDYQDGVPLSTGQHHDP